MLARMRFWRWAILSALAAMAVALPAFGGGGARRPAGKAPPLVVTVEYGDSLWTIAQEHGNPRCDVREIVYEIRRANSVAPERLRPGSRLVIPRTCLPRER